MSRPLVLCAALLAGTLLAPSPVPAGEVAYTVLEGQSLSLICREAYGDKGLFPLLALYNGREDPERLSAGETIRLPFSDRVTLRRGESLSRLAKRTWKDAKKYPVIAWANGIGDPALVSEGTGLSVPVLVPYRLRRGESVSSVAGRFYGDEKEFGPILWASGIEDPRRVPAGAVLNVPFLFPHPDMKGLRAAGEAAAAEKEAEEKARAEAGARKAEALLQQARAAFRSGRYDDALDSGREASRGLEGARRAEALRLLADCQYAFRRMGETLRYLEAAYELDPGFTPDPALVNPEMMALYERARGQ